MVVDCVFAPFDQVFPFVTDEVSTTLFPEQKVVGPAAVIDGAEGIGLTVITVGVEVTVGQVGDVTETVYEPPAETVMDCVVAPVDQLLLLEEDEVSVTLSPAQMVVDPLFVITGVGVPGTTVILIGEEVNGGQPPSVEVTVYVPDVVTTMDGDVSLLDHVFPVDEEEFSVTLPPEQNVVGPLAVITGVLCIVTTVGADG